MFNRELVNPSLTLNVITCSPISVAETGAAIIFPPEIDNAVVGLA
jgi:hypothetical protein